MFDIAIIGSGPAALSAAVNARQRNKSVCVFGRSLDSSLLFAAEKVDNYLGMPDLSGEEMLNQFYAHAVKRGVEFKESRISQIMPMGNYFMINADNEFYEAKTLILAIGLNKSKGIAGEMEYLGKGVSYCATCDGMLYRNKKVVVVGEHEEGEAEANFLADVCEKVMYVPLYQPVLNLKETVEILRGKPKAVVGENGKVTGINMDEESVACDGIFFAKNSTPPESLVFGLATDGKNIIVDRSMATNLPGVFAAGD
ncbi:MAG: NAD(P)/FAD-dependent oxidoreductase, partial [Anaerotignum sp.]|nr:NAD(P)/FAD-dependent oxidoreductase [Anaerotignum sp.]